VLDDGTTIPNNQDEKRGVFQDANWAGYQRPPKVLTNREKALANTWDSRDNW